MIKTKFKHTEIGYVPHDWNVWGFYEIFSKIPNNTYAREYMNDDHGRIHNIHYGDILVKYGAIVNFEKDSIPFLNDNVVVNLNKQQLQEGDVIIADTAEDETAGKAIEIWNLGNRKAVSGLHTMAFRPKIGFTPKYLGYFMNASIFHNQLLPYQTGTKVTSISKSVMGKFYVAAPATTTEQSNITIALSDIDELIQNLQALICKKENIKTGTMQQLLSGKTRLKGFEDEWERKAVFAITGKIRRGQTLKSDDFVYGNIPVMAGGKQYAGYHNVANQNGRTITLSGSGASAGFVAIHNVPIFATDCSVIVESKKFSLDFLYYLLAYKQDDLYKLQTGGAQPHVYPRDIERVEVYQPKAIQEQRAIAKVLLEEDEEIDMLKARLQKYQDIRTGMMQQLLTGKIRLI